MASWDENGVQRRVAGSHDFRMDGMRDLLWRAEGASVLDIGCNRGAVALDFAHHGARIVHGCDIYERGMEVAREIFADIRSVKSRFEVVDLSKGATSLGVFGEKKYDIVVMLATYHKLKRIMRDDVLSGLVKEIGSKTNHYFAWRGTSFEYEENKREMLKLDQDLGLKRVHTSTISKELGLAAIWERQ